jgi:3-isopropylmalate/(R)-2-methylmalate dehydratase small subunit
MERAQNDPGYKLTIDLESQTVSDDRDALASFDIDPFVKHRLLNGLDDIGLTLQNEGAITAFEKTRSNLLPLTK